MSIKITAGQLRTATLSMNGVPSPLQAALAEKMPMKTAYWFARLISKAEREAQIVEDRRQALVKELGVETGGNFTVAKDRLEEFMTRFGELLAVEIELDKVEPIAIEALSGINISPENLLALMPFLKEEPEA